MTRAARNLTGGDLAARTLKAAGVTQVFALHGGHHEALFKGCVDQGISLLDFRHEAAAGHAADAYARTTGKLGVCVITAGPGFTNAISAITNAYLDGSSVLFIIGAPPLREVETNPLQGGIDQIAAARPLCKWAISVPATERIPDLTAMAIRKAMTGRKGPVVLELPIDVLHMSVPEEQATAAAGVNVRPHPAPARDELDSLIALIRESRRPAIIAGLEAVSQSCAVALERLATQTRIPVFVKAQAAGVLPDDHPAYGGAAGNLAILPMLGQEAPDLVILAGARMGLLLGGRSGAIVPHAAKVVQIHSDAGEIGRIRDVQLGIAASTDVAIDALCAAMSVGVAPDFSDWCAKATSVRRLFAASFPDVETANGVHPFHAARAVAEAAGPSAAYVLDGGESASWAGAAISPDGPGRVQTHGYLGCLGIGPGFAIGCQTAHLDRRVVQITGDGTMGFHIQELDTMVRHKLPIVTVVLNNQVWGMSIHGQQIMFGGNYNVITRLGGTRYADIAAAFGCHSERVTRHADVGPAVTRALQSGRAALVEVMTDPDVVHPVTVSMLGQTAEGSGDVMIPYYENIPFRS
ncbi:MAG: thiamine pyrophosphate-binding protein [Hyphomonadaceae bacterium]|nr:MAG: acetolactate synthase I/II/III large subunit [Caulobacteraceae bacterium]MBT9445682.1 thiamine pyrophosphate-binding protein [Hyphomonadaceae bacterium]TPW08329.1 MAG: acetolactate synthase I/II/III large subunit [Alphaproteobacteria bacterium]